MARRRAPKTPLDLIPPLAGLLLMVWIFVPGGAQLMQFVIALAAGGAVLVALGAIIWWYVKRKRSAEPNWFGSTAPAVAVTNSSPVPVSRNWTTTEPLPERPKAQREWSADLLSRLEWKRFEDVVANYFTRQGYRAETTRIGADGGVDVYLYRAPDSAPVAVVQCKAWNVYDVGVKAVRELFGVMAAAKISQGFFVTTGSFTLEARHFGRDNEIVLIDGDDLLDRFRQLASSDSAELLEFATAGDFATPTCPRCGVKMVTRTSSKDQSTFWGCRHFPRCRQTFKVSSCGG